MTRRRQRFAETAYSAAGLHPGGIPLDASMFPEGTAVRKLLEQWASPGPLVCCPHAPPQRDLHAMPCMDRTSDGARLALCAECFDKGRLDWIRNGPGECCDACDVYGTTDTFRFPAAEFMLERPSGDTLAMQVVGWVQICGDCLAEARPA